MRALLCVMLVACSKPSPPAAAVDGGTDTLAAALADLEDGGGDAVIYAHDVTVTKIDVSPKDALTRSVADAALKAERWRFRACAAHVSKETTANLTTRVGEGGEVISATAEAPAALSKCLCDAALKMKLPEPTGGHAALEITLEYAPR